MNSRKFVLSVCLPLLVVYGCGGGASPTAPAKPIADPISAPPAIPAPPSSPIVADAVLAGAGDIARCNGVETAATAALLDRIDGTVFTLGDTVYPNSTASTLAACYAPTWGRHKERTLATIGNHDYEVNRGEPYYAYFGAAAGPAGLGYYSTTVGAWQIISLNSNIASGPGSAQYEWLRSELASSNATCTLAMWHHPVFSSGVNGNSSQMRDAWRLLQQFGADIILNGHDHAYERFAPQNADGRADPRGIREFVVGTGGVSLYDRVSSQPNSEVFENRTWGVLKLTLKSDRYAWEFVPIAGQSFTDSGTASCVPGSGTP
ncbi:MAG TPA: metallophosphoesterase [Vicinamibacterales bacterium]